LCGLEFGASALAPGASETFILTVDGDRCEGGALLSMASMLGETVTHSGDEVIKIALLSED